jgi:ABC-type multidrug transport system ATPase subunit
MTLEIRDLSKRYANGVQALDRISLDVPCGMFGLLGPNGAGKSTLMRTLATLQDADSGTAMLDGIDVLRDKPAVRRILGYLPQEFGLYPKATALELLDHFARLKGIAGRQRRVVVESLLHRTNLWAARRRQLATYSGGMKQRFGIAQALLGEPRLIIVDEPTAGLDPEERVRFHNLLGEIGESVVVILSTHIVDDVADLCRHMAIIDHGRVVRAGDPAELVRELRERIWRRPLSPGEELPEMLRPRLIAQRRMAGRLMAFVHADARPDDGFEPVEPSLEHVYFLAIGSPAAATPGRA